MVLHAEEKTSKPNVVFIMCDDLNDFQGVFGGHPQAKTPHIDGMAAKGVRFMNAQSNVPVCQPSRNSLFTGVYPHVSGDFGWTKRTKQAVLKNNKALIGLFKENGYYTLGSGKLLHSNERGLWNEWGMNDKHNYGPFPFDGEKLMPHPDVPAPFNSIGAIDGSYGRLSTCSKWTYGWDKKPFRYNSEDDRDLMQDELHTKWATKKIKELEAKDTDQPFFMGVGYVNPHTPLYAPDRFFDLFPIESLVLNDYFETDAADTYLKDNIDPNSKGYKYYRMLLESYDGDREVALKHFLQAYLACVAFVDEQIGEVLNAIEESKFNDNTIVVLTSDHGWQMGEKDYLFKNSPWEKSTRIPLVIKAPDAQQGAQIEQPVSLVDIYPTLVDYCELKGETKLNSNGGELGGYSMVPLFDTDENTKWQGPNGALSIVGNVGGKTKANEQHYSYRTKDWRYIRYADGKEELYYHVNDPNEWNNLADLPKYKTTKKGLYKEMSAIINPRPKIEVKHRSATDKPNLIVVMTDDLGYADVGFNGCKDIPTPNIDRIANEGVSFTNAYTSYSVCGPSRAGFMTGRYQQRFGFERNPQYRPNDPNMGLPNDEMTIAESLVQVGYKSTVIGKWHLGANKEAHHPLNRGFTEFYGHLGGGHRFFPEELTIEDSYAINGETDSYRTWIMRDHEPVKTDKYLTDEFSDEAISFVERNADEPFFMFLSYNAPHLPLQATDECLQRFNHIKDPERKTYAAMVSAVDDGVGRLLDTLEDLDIDENTVICFLSDNGGPERKNASDNGPLREGKSSNYEGGFRVPFALKWEGQVAPTVYDFPISSLDIFATIADLSNSPVNADKPLDGVNLIPYVQGKNKKAPHQSIYLRKFDQKRYAVRNGDYKLVVNGEVKELYNLSKDIGEKNNLASKMPEKVKSLDAILMEWADELIDPNFLGLMHTEQWKYKGKKK